MKKTMIFSLVLVLTFCATACNSSAPPSSASPSSAPFSSAPPSFADASPATTTADDKTYGLRVSTNLAATSTVGRALTYFVEQINAQSDGRIKAYANYGSELGSQSEQVAMALSGDLEMVAAAPGTGPGSFRSLEPLMMFEFPFLFQDNDHYRRVLKAAEPHVNGLSQTIGLTAMAGQSQGLRDILTTKPVNSLADMQDLVMRGPNTVYISMFEALGAAGITMTGTRFTQHFHRMRQMVPKVRLPRLMPASSRITPDILLSPTILSHVFTTSIAWNGMILYHRICRI